jgi:hypothetical protein
MVYVLGMACIAWTVFELVRMARETPSLVRTRAAQGARAPLRPRRLPLAAWDEQGRPIFVEDVSHRGPR